MTSPALTICKTACDFLSWQRLFHLFHLQPPNQLILMVTYDATLKLAELEPPLSLRLSETVMTLYIQSSTNKGR